jgi:hypothetical protein
MSCPSDLLGMILIIYYYCFVLAAMAMMRRILQSYIRAVRKKDRRFEITHSFHLQDRKVKQLRNSVRVHGIISSFNTCLRLQLVKSSHCSLYSCYCPDTALSTRFSRHINIRTLCSQARDVSKALPSRVSVNELRFLTGRKNNIKCNVRGYKITSVASSVNGGAAERVNNSVLRNEGKGCYF